VRILVQLALLVHKVRILTRVWSSSIWISARRPHRALASAQRLRQVLSVLALLVHKCKH
jgi:hypothetical protein